MAEQLFLEICAGSARLTSTLRRHGIEAWAVDHKAGRIQPECDALLYLDLTVQADVSALHRLLRHPRLTFVHLDPPFGTCSRARDRAAAGVPGGGPPPIRSEDFPLGFPDLAERLPRQLPRLRAANLVYDVIFGIAADLLQRGIAFSLANPTNSILWHFPKAKVILGHDNVAEVRFQHCMFGSKQPFSTSFWFSPPHLFPDLHRICDGSHKHVRRGRGLGGKWHTSASADTVYPQPLCDEIAALLLRFFGCSSARPRPVVRARRPPEQARLRLEREAAGLQPRGTKARRLLPEFRRTFSITAAFPPGAPECRIGHRWTAGRAHGVDVPPLARTIAVTFMQAPAASTSCSAASSVAGEPLEPQLTLPTRASLRDARFLSEHDLYIGREHVGRGGRRLAASCWANPFRVKDCRDVLEAISKFESHLLSSPTLLARLKELSGRRLVCHCAKDAPCHGDVLIRAFRERLLAADQLH